MAEPKDWKSWLPEPKGLATLNEAKAVVTQYHKYLSENSLIKTVVETDGSVAHGNFLRLEKQ
jgi:hypothetical protein